MSLPQLPISQTPIISSDPTPRGFITADLGLAQVAPNLYNLANLDYCNVYNTPLPPGDLGYPNQIIFHLGAPTSFGPAIGVINNWTAGGIPQTYNINCPLPTGLALNNTSGVISGTATTASHNQFTVLASNASGMSYQTIEIITE